jgi:hypothetical protein
MKNIGILLLILLFAVNTKSFAGVNNSEFIGKWKITMFDLPNGDRIMELHLSEKNDELVGVLTNEVGKEDHEDIKINEIVINKKELSFTFETETGRIVNLNLELIGEGKCEGYLIDMFLVEGKKINEAA